MVGTLDKNKKEITTTIPQFGVYALCFNMEAIEFESKDFQLSFQRRMFSSQGGGHDTQTAKLFELDKESTITLKSTTQQEDWSKY